MSAERNPTPSIYDLTERELLILRRQVDDRKKSAVTTWLGWLLLGMFGAHRLYLGRKDTGVLMLLTQATLLVWYWYLGGGRMDIPVGRDFLRGLDLILRTGIAYLVQGGLVVWYIVDAFLIHGMLATNKRQAEEEALKEIAATRKGQA